LLIVRGLEDDGVFFLAGHCGCDLRWGKGVCEKEVSMDGKSKSSSVD
jgi:hypothetical protein